MSEYQLTATESSVTRTMDQAGIPNDPANRDWVEYQQWLEDGNTPDPYVAPPEPKPSPTPEDAVLFNHENRIRALEGVPEISIEEFRKK